ncbi:MAG: hypothetical protein OXD31_01065 [Chloroflexi bacterium]|nr:hypothetical protein [Chloroflexota bacterium]
MCITNALQQKIRKHTDNGDLIAQFLADTIRGEYPDAKYHHKLEAAKLLARYGSDQPQSEESQFWGLIPTPEELVESHSRHSGENENPDGSGGETDNSGLTTENSPVTHLDILNYDIAHLIRQETAEGHTIAEFLAHVMTRRDQPFTPKKLRIRHTDRMAAAREILRRGHGHWGRKPKLKVYADDIEDSNDCDTLHSDLAKRMREYNEHGTDAIRFLLDVMNDTSLDPEEGYTWHHKMSAAHEIIRRGWDTNYDKITPEMLQAYWQDQQSTRLSSGQKKQLAGLPAFLDEYAQYDNEDYEAIAQELRDQEDREEAADFKAASAPGKSPLSPGERARVRGNAHASSPPQNNAATPTHHSCESRNPAGPESPLSPRERARVRGSEEPHHSQSTPTNDESDIFDDLDCYYEPLTPEDQAIFNYNSLIESGEFTEGEITFVPPSEAAHRDYAIALKQIREAATSEGVPLLPNPLAGTLRKPNIRSP